MTYLPYGPFDSVEELVNKLIIGRIANSTDQFLFAIYDKSGTVYTYLTALKFS